MFIKFFQLIFRSSVEAERKRGRERKNVKKKSMKKTATEKGQSYCNLMQRRCLVALAHTSRLGRKVDDARPSFRLQKEKKTLRESKMG